MNVVIMITKLKLKALTVCNSRHTEQYPCVYDVEITDNQQPILCFSGNITYQVVSISRMKYSKPEHK
ncbi:MAG: hypothetical protein KAI74_05170, partial [Kiritimatiellae bacterium]|nr:hypothetical protein [Kiritimatiellia bacterium]